MYEENREPIRFIYFVQKAKVDYMSSEYEKAYETIKLVDYNNNINHKIDYMVLWSAKTYEGMILYKLGKQSEAIESMETSVKKLEAIESSMYLGFAYKNLSRVYYETENYKNAYEILNKSSTYNIPEGCLV